MGKLNQVLAVEPSIKARHERAKTDAYHALQRSEPLAGLSRTYRPKDDEGDMFPSESVLVQVKAEDIIDDFTRAVTELFDITATKSFANTAAKATVVVDGVTLVVDAPVDYLLFLEKQLVDLQTFISKIPVLSPDRSWEYDSNVGVYVTPPVETVKQKKVPRNHVKAEATDKHPAQVEVYQEDIVQGYWTKIDFSGALPADRVRTFRDRVESVQKAVKAAREEANSTEAPNKKIGEDFLSFIFS